jgi:catalase
MLGHLKHIEPELHDRVATAMGMQGMADEIRVALAPRDLPPSPALSMLAKAPATLQGRKLGILVGDGFDRELVAELTAAIDKEHAMVELVAARIGGARASDGTVVPADHTITGGPSVLFDAVAVIPGTALDDLLADPAAIAWVSDAFVHCKVIAASPDARPLLDAARVTSDPGVIELTAGAAIATFIATAKKGRLWSREAPTSPAPPSVPAPSSTPDRRASRPKH